MTIIRHRQVIHAPVDAVFAVVADGGAFERWNPTVRASRVLTEGPVGDGTTFEWELRGFGKLRQEVREFEAGRRLRIVPDMGVLSGGHRFTFTPVADGTQVDHELEMTPRGLFKAFTPIMGAIGRRNLRDTADALRRAVEEPV